MHQCDIKRKFSNLSDVLQSIFVYRVPAFRNKYPRMQCNKSETEKTNLILFLGSSRLYKFLRALHMVIYNRFSLRFRPYILGFL